MTWLGHWDTRVQTTLKKKSQVNTDVDTFISFIDGNCMGFTAKVPTEG